VSSGKLLIRFTWLVIVAGFLIVATHRDLGNWRFEPAGSPMVPGPRSTHLSGWDEFFASDAWRGSDRPPVVFIGIDGASWGFIDPLIKRGELPNLARLKEEGAYGTLRSLPCFVSPPSWVTMLTGYLPEKTGVYTFGKLDRHTRRFQSVDAEDVEVRSVWDVVSYSGGKVGVFNVPVTYPPHPVNGVMVAGMMTPSKASEIPRGRTYNGEGPLRQTDFDSYSPVLRTAIDDSLNVYFWSLIDTIDDGVKRYDEVILTVVSRSDTPATDARIRFYTFQVGEFSPWIQIRSQRGARSEDAWCRAAIVETPDGRYETRVSRAFYRIDGAFTYPDTIATMLDAAFDCYVPGAFVGAELVPDMTVDAASHASYFYGLDDWDLFLYVFTQSDNIHHLTGFSPGAVEVYKTIDRFIGRMMNEMPDDGRLVIASDHGFRRYTYGVDLNRFFESLGLLRWRDDGTVDVERSLVFHHLWHLYFNRELMTRHEFGKRGIEVPRSRDPVEFFATYLEQAARKIESDDGAVSVSIGLRRLRRGAVGEAPDMIVDAVSGNCVVDFLGFDHRRERTVRRLVGAERWWHARDGIFLVWGGGVREEYDAGSRDIQDIAPTLLYLLGLPLAADMDGDPMLDIFEKRWVAGTPVYVVDDYTEIPSASIVRRSERESLDKKLRSLGYLR
jgi:predicted AlkP superfamily phosphohydrolase/phosphomutase